MLNGFKTYNKKELFEKVDAIEIVKVGESVVTKYFDVVINSTPVSKRYEIFDIRSFMKEKISHIESNFKISHYRFVMKRGIQQLILLSDSVDINGSPYHKSFYILNSSDKSRRLNMNLGLYRGDNNMYLVFGVNNMTLCKKHLTGVTKMAEEVSQSFDGETFTEQINSIKSLIGEKVLLSKVREIIVDKDKPDLTRIAAVNTAITIGKFASGVKNAIRGAKGVTLVFSPDMLIGFDHKEELDPIKQLPEPSEVFENMADYL